MEREKIDFTDKELYYVALAFESHLNSRDTWISKGGAKVINNAIKKITENGLKRKNPKSILHPIYQFENEEQYYLQLTDISNFTKKNDKPKGLQ